MIFLTSTHGDGDNDHSFYSQGIPPGVFFLRLLRIISLQFTFIKFIFAHFLSTRFTFFPPSNFSSVKTHPAPTSPNPTCQSFLSRLLSIWRNAVTLPNLQFPICPFLAVKHQEPQYQRLSGPLNFGFPVLLFDCICIYIFRFCFCCRA